MMIKENKRQKPLFHPTFGSRPAQIVGREELLQDFMRGLQEPIGSRERCRFYSGQRGMGKTALLLEMEDRAAEMGYVTARVTAYPGMNDDIIETIQRNGSPFVTSEKKSVQGVSAGALGFSFGLTFSAEAKEQYGFRTKLHMLCEELEKHDKGILILVDEARTSEAMQQLAVTYQHLVGEEKDIAIVMAGLPQAISGVLNDDILTFLNRAFKTRIGGIRTADIRQYYEDAFEQLRIEASSDALDDLAAASEGFPYLMQLIGYYASRNRELNQADEAQWIRTSVSQAKGDLAENVFAPILAPLSDRDLDFIKAMSEDERVSKISELCHRLGKSNSYIQPYRARMIEAGIVESPRNGELVFAVPYLGEYLRSLR